MTKIETGVVIKSTGSWYHVLNSDNTIAECRLRGKFRTKGIKTTNPVAVGDIVDYEIDTHAIVNIHPRKNYIIRKSIKLSKQSHIIASNMDQAVVIGSLKNPRTSTGFIDRFLVTAEAYHIPGIIVFNKIDLLEDEDDLNKIILVYENIGYKCLKTSVKDSINLDEFKNILSGKVSLLSGHSGVGKSALINTLDANLELKTGEISDYHAKGMHTTTFAEMFKLDDNTSIIDSPGIKELGLVGFEKYELGHRFPEIRELQNECKYNNCLHLNEPGCAVKRAYEEGEISSFRYINYLNMLESI
ncbi:MAG: ribosome small subunit-dependent GTPase A [Marinilabiliales bacterium]|nr:MAG: ribosome small subunit-dependent GTPase A [Marinilabiliales bacterium]